MGCDNLTTLDFRVQGLPSGGGNCLQKDQGLISASVAQPKSPCPIGSNFEFPKEGTTMAPNPKHFLLQLRIARATARN